MTATRPVTVVIRTIGRPELLAQVLDSLAGCAPRAAEILIVDQSRRPETAEVAARYPQLAVRVFRCPKRGRGAAANSGLAAATHDVVLFTDDDCIVAPDWIGVAHELVAGQDDLLVAGRVLPLGDPRHVPSRIELTTRKDWSDRRVEAQMYAANLVCPRRPALALGFDEELDTMEDWDFALRWLRGRRRLFYEPSLTVWHDDWRTPADVEETWEAYGEGCARLYAKMLRDRDPLVLRFLFRNARDAAMGVVAERIYGPRWWDARPGVRRGMLRGVAAELRGARPRRRGRPTA